ncbi:MAG: hypothetical protein FWC64_09740 [Treponema sp.]|nr:hypothetical protein [Treponema sp.]
MQNVSDFITTQPEIVWLIALMGAVAVIGLVNFLKCFIHGKKAVKWIVLFVSLGIAFILSPLTPPIVTTVVILWLLVLAIATIARDAIVDGMPKLIGGLMNRSTGETQGGRRWE